jgi:hypothetical protein
VRVAEFGNIKDPLKNSSPEHPLAFSPDLAYYLLTTAPSLATSNSKSIFVLCNSTCTKMGTRWASNGTSQSSKLRINGAATSYHWFHARSAFLCDVDKKEQISSVELLFAFMQ